MKTTTLILATLMLTGACYAQAEANKAPAEPKHYRLDFGVRELEAGKPGSTRAYTMTIGYGPPFNGNSSVRIGDKIPVPAGGKEGAFTFIDVGVNIDCRLLRATDNQITVQVTADISSVAGGNSGSVPVISQTRWNAEAVVPLRKPTMLFSADGATTKRQMQLELTVTPFP